MKRLTTLALHLALAATLHAMPQAQREIRAIYNMAGQPTGAYREIETRANGEIDTDIDSTLVFNRLGNKLEVKSSTRYRESSDGKFLGVVSDASSSAQTTRITVTVKGDQLSISTTAGGKTYDRIVPFKGTLVGPAAARALAMSGLHKVGDSLTYQTFIAELGTVSTVVDKVVAAEPFALQRSKVPGVKVEQVFSAMPGKSIVWLDRDGWMLSQTIPSPLGEIVATRSAAGEGFDPSKAAELPKEMFTKTIVTSNIRLPEERLIEEMKIRITFKKPELGLPDLEAPNQRVLAKSKNEVVLQITRPKPSGTMARPAAINSNTKQYLAPNALLQCDDPGVKAIAAKVVKNADDAWTATRALQKWTNENMHFDLGVAIVPASEVAKNRGGTCFGYSMLLGSLVRAAGVPSRVRMGLVYAGGIWGGHAWVEVLINGKWIPVDAALYSPGPADAARFSCFTGSLEENTVSNMGSLSQIFGNVDVQVLEYTVGGKSTTVPQAVERYAVKGETYLNPWLKFSVTKPSGFKFTSYDVTWPLTTLVAMQGPKGARVEVKDESASLPTGSLSETRYVRDLGYGGKPMPRKIAGRTMFVVHGGGKVALFFRAGGGVWLVEASGPSAERNLVKVATTIKVGS